MASGIYMIVNTENLKTYVGSAADLTKRNGKHFSMLRAGAHPSRHLQAAFLKYGSAAFEFRVLVEVGSPSRESLLAQEQLWIDTLQPEYNKRLTADSNLGLPMDAAQKKAISAAQKQYRATDAGKAHAERLRMLNKELWADPSRKAERIAALKAVWTPEKRASQAVNSKARTSHISPDGTHFGTKRIWTTEEKLRSGVSMVEAWKTRHPVSEVDIQRLVQDTNASWVATGMTGARNADTVTIYCKTHNCAQVQKIAKLRYEGRGCKLCGYQRSSELQIGRAKSKHTSVFKI